MAQECLASWKSPIMIGATFGGFFIVIGLNMTIEAFVQSYNAEEAGPSNMDDSTESMFVDGPIMMGIGFISVFVGGLGSCRKFRNQRNREGSITEDVVTTEAGERTQTTSLSSSLPDIATRPSTTSADRKSTTTQPSSTSSEITLALADLSDLGIAGKGRSVVASENTTGPKRSISGEIAELVKERRKSITLPRPIPLPIYEEELEDDVFKSDSSANVDGMKQNKAPAQLASYSVRETSLGSAQGSACRKSATLENISKLQHPPGKKLKTRMTSDDVLLALRPNTRRRYDDINDRPSLSGTSDKLSSAGDLPSKYRSRPATQAPHNRQLRQRDSGYFPSDSSRSGPEPKNLTDGNILKNHMERQAYSDSETSSIFSLENDLIKDDKTGSYDDIVSSRTSRKCWDYEVEPKPSPVQGRNVTFKKARSPDDVSKRWIETMTPAGRTDTSRQSCRSKQRRVSHLRVEALPHTSSSGPSLSPSSPTPLLPFSQPSFRFPAPVSSSKLSPASRAARSHSTSPVLVSGRLHNEQQSAYSTDDTSFSDLHPRCASWDGEFEGVNKPRTVSKHSRRSRSPVRRNSKSSVSRMSNRTVGSVTQFEWKQTMTGHVSKQKDSGQRMPVTDLSRVSAGKVGSGMQHSSHSASSNAQLDPDKCLSDSPFTQDSRRQSKARLHSSVIPSAPHTPGRHRRTVLSSTDSERRSRYPSSDGSEFQRPASKANKSSPSKTGRQLPKLPRPVAHPVYPKRTPKSGRRQLPDLDMCRRRVMHCPDGAPPMASREGRYDVTDDVVVDIQSPPTHPSGDILERQDTLPWV